MHEGVWEPAAAPYIHLRRDGDQVHLWGVAEARFGHRIDLPDGTQDGNWAEWRWDGRRLSVANDRFGAYPLYLAMTADEVAVSPSIDALLASGIDRRLDYDALAAFLTVGFFFGTDTPFASIRSLPPAATVTWAPDELHIVSDPPPRPPFSATREQAVTGAAELVREAVRRRIPDDEVYDLPLSGGRDSRHLLLELLDAGHPPRRCVTAHHHPNLWGGDVPYAAQLAARYWLEHRALQPGPLIEEEWRKNRLTSYCADEHAWYRCVAAELNGQVSHTYDGLNGSTSMAREYYHPRMRRLDQARRLDELAAFLGRKQRGEPRFAPLIAADARSLLSAERAAARIRAELERYADQPEPFLAARFWSRTVGELNLTCTLMLHGVSAAYTPFLDPEVVRFMWSVPSEHVDDSFHDDVIAARFPHGNEVPYLEKRQPQPPRTFLREMNRDLLALLRTHSDGSLVDRGSLTRRAVLGAAIGDGWFAWGRRAALTTYLVQLETVVAGRGPMDLA